MDFPRGEASSCRCCGRTSARIEAAHKLIEAWACLDEWVPADRHGMQLRFLAAGVYALLESSPYPLVSLTYRDIGVQVARPEQAIFDEMQELEQLGWVGLYDRGRGEHEKHPDGCQAATWEVGSVWKDTETGRQRAEARVSAARAGRYLSEDDLELIRYMHDQRAADWDVDEDGEVDWGFIGGAASQDHAQWVAGWEPGTQQDFDEAKMPWIAALQDPDNVRCQDLLKHSMYLFNKKYIYLQMDTPARGTDSQPFPASAVSPIDYSTWADCFRDEEAGVPGWSLARLQIRDMKPHGQPVDDCLGPVDGAEVGRRIGVTRQAGLQILKRLARRGYAERQPDGRYRLLFSDLYSAGRLLSDKQALNLAEGNKMALKQRAARMAGTGPNQNPRPMGGFSWETRIFGPEATSGGTVSD